MASSPASRFNCLNCGAVYEVVYVEAEAVALNRELACLSCGASLQARQGQFALKYFLLERPFSVRPGPIRELVWGRISAGANAKAISSTERRRKAAPLRTP